MQGPNVASLPVNRTVLGVGERPDVFAALAASGTEVAQGLEDCRAQEGRLVMGQNGIEMHSPFS